MQSLSGQRRIIEAIVSRAKTDEQKKDGHFNDIAVVNGGLKNRL